MDFAAGIDVGSTQTKAVLLDTARAIVARVLINTGANVKRAGQTALDALLERSGASREHIGFVVGTGYGRYKIEAGNAQVTEISCHARGAQFLFPATRTVIDMGGQDTKAIKVGPEGDVIDFCMNDKCAAGTGRFLAGAADVLGLPLDEIGDISLRGTQPIRLTSVCTVFVESDILGYVAQKKKIEDILAGVHQAIAARTIGLVRRVGIEPEITFTGGVARNIGMVRALERKLDATLNVSAEAHFTGALGAALYALDHVLAARREEPAVAEVAAVWVDQ
ncbi:MAG: 2-hydroxyglutaryl-CoA dehydratase [Phycisphaerae bacterium]|nr:acyl-CoA dehydratase activase [Phycisphaerae bacterium]NUQ45834.1 2-hydroxyglutaryl-CoA dehydratase [Phycisphaerae bacterium]